MQLGTRRTSSSSTTSARTPTAIAKKVDQVDVLESSSPRTAAAKKAEVDRELLEAEVERRFRKLLDDIHSSSLPSSSSRTTTTSCSSSRSTTSSTTTCSTCSSSSTSSHRTDKDIKEVLTMKPFTFCELFAGLGGFRIGLEALGGTCVFASEINPVCQAVYAGRWKEVSSYRARDTSTDSREMNMKTSHINYVPGPAAKSELLSGDISAMGPGQLHGDITKIPCSAIPDHDLLVGGFPCQPFSRLGNQDAFDEKRGRGVLYLEILRILEQKQPRMFLLENVPGIADQHQGENAVLDYKHQGENAVAHEDKDWTTTGSGPPYKRQKLSSSKEAVSVKQISSSSSSRNTSTSSPTLLDEKKSSPLDIILSDLRLGGKYSVQAKIYSSAPLTAQQRKRVYFVGVLRQEGKKRRKIRFPEEILPDLGLTAADVIDFEEKKDKSRSKLALTPMGKGKGKSSSSSSSSISRTPLEDKTRPLRLSPAQFAKLWPKLPYLQREGKNLFVNPQTTKKLGPIVSHYGHSPGHGNCQLVARPADSLEGGVPRLLSNEECLRVMGINPAKFLPDMESVWVPSAVKFPYSKPLIKKSCYHIIGNAVCPPVIAWLVEKVVLPAGGFVEKKIVASASAEKEEARLLCKQQGSADGDAEMQEQEQLLPAYLRLALEAIRDF
ncbi:unnamed protein product [Amoebophrya sp. A25]|nr:unnamed protein product [Amoebophrya sp. A25]|eukprot:GSA25T00019146001.1